MSLLRVLLLFALSTCGLAGAVQAAPRYVDARDYPTQGAGAKAFAQMQASLVQGFDWVCGDTFCEGLHDNYLPLRLSCAVRADNGVLKSCHWALVGSNEHIDPTRGAITSEVTSAVRGLPLAEGTLLSTLLASVEGGNNLHKPLPGTTRSAYDGLADCLSARHGGG